MSSPATTPGIAQRAYTPAAAHVAGLAHPGWDTPVRVASEERPMEGDDESITAQTIGRMAQFVVVDSRSEIVRRAAAEAAAHASTPMELLAAIHAWIRSRVRFQEDAVTAAPFAEDPDQAEVLIRPVDLLTMPNAAGDCDDFTMLAAAMLRALGIDSEFVTVAADAAMPQIYTHVYLRALVQPSPVPMDCSHGPQPGWEVSPKGKRRYWPIKESAMEATHTMGAIDWGRILETTVNAGTNIAQARYGQPNIAPGTYVQNQDGVMFRQQPGAGAFTFPGAGINIGTPAVGGNSGGLLLLVAVGLVLVLALKK